jgi:phage shock protein E
MKNFTLALIAITIIAVGFIVVSSNDTTDNNSTPNAELTTIQNDLDAGAVLVDVRTPAEFAQSHAVSAINVPLQNIQQGDYGSLQPDQKLYIYCRSGNRSAQAISILNQNGYNDTIDLVSLTQWQSLGGDVTSN